MYCSRHNEYFNFFEKEKCQGCVREGYKLKSITWSDVPNYKYGGDDTENRPLWFGEQPTYETWIKECLDGDRLRCSECYRTWHISELLEVLVGGDGSLMCPECGSLDFEDLVKFVVSKLKEK